MKENIYPEFSRNALTVLARRYLKKGPDNKPMETPEDLLRRVAHNVAQAELNYSDDPGSAATAEADFYYLMRSLRFLPNSPTLMNAGRELQQLSACFVLPVADSLDSIFQGIKETATIHKSGGGTGFDFSQIRPQGDSVGSTGGIASGPVSFMTAYDRATEVVKQGGTRRGANMAIMSVSHPDIIKFIRMKQDPETMQNFNISVGVPDAFMEAVIRRGKWTLVNPRNRQPVNEIAAETIFQTIVECAWETGDPGLVFFDRINENHPNGHLGEITATNPCGEQPLLDYESCNLGSINLARMLNETGDDIDWELLNETVAAAVHFLDNVIDMSQYPIREIAERARNTRRIGLGVMGFADLLISLNIRYDSEPARTLADRIMQQIRNEAHSAGRKLAETRGPYPEWAQAQEWNRINRPHLATGKPVRHTQPTTIAPTGTISIIAGCSSGIEPLFALAYTRNVMDNDRLPELNEQFRQALYAAGYDEKHPEVRTALATGSAANTQLPRNIREIFRVSHDIDVDAHIRMQAAWQKHCDNAVSKTINLPGNADREAVAAAYLQAYRSGCKGITIYRDGSKANQVLATNAGTEVKPPAEQPGPAPRPRPRLNYGETRRLQTGHGSVYVTINTDPAGRPFEVFTNAGKAGGCDSAYLEAIARLISIQLRAGIKPDWIIQELQGITCCPAWDEGQLIQSTPDAIAKAIQLFINPAESRFPAAWQPNLNLEPPHTDNHRARCPDCNAPVIHAEGCSSCTNAECGWNRCS